MHEDGLSRREAKATSQLLRSEDHVFSFLNNANEVAYLEGNNWNRNVDINKALELITNDKYQIFRSMDNKDNTTLFPLDIEFPHHQAPTIEAGLKSSFKICKKLEKMFPDQFAFTISGRGFHGFSIIDKTDDRYAIMIHTARSLDSLIGSYGFFCDTDYKKNGIIRSIGTFNPKSNLWDVPIDIKNDTFEDIIRKSKARDLSKELIIHKLSESLIAKSSFNMQTVSVSKISHKFNYSAVNSVLDLRFLPPCVRTLFDPDIYKSHYLRLLAITYLSKAIIRFSNGDWRTLTQDDIYDVMSSHVPEGSYFEPGTFKHSVREKTIEYVANKEYEVPSCSTVRLWGYCIDNCNRIDLFDID